MTRACLLVAALAYTLTPARAEACGGTFCDGGATPVTQTGETVLFVMSEGATEAHIQIAYDPATDADQFAWVVPITSVPEFSVGSQPLFDALKAATVPAYGFTRQFDACGDDGGAPPSAADSGGSVKFDLAGDDDGPDVLVQQTVGAFEITVLSGGTAAEVMQWLGDNGYTQDPAAEPILGEYLAEDYLFAAFKLAQGSDTSEIHPVVLRFAEEEACVPLRLTRIAARDDMAVRTFFLADARVVPQNYKHVLVNPLALDWPNVAANYQEVITLAVDAFAADGKAWVTEYAGPASIVDDTTVLDDRWDASAIASLAPDEAIATLASQALIACTGEGMDARCSETHALVRGLLLQYLPPPADVEPEAYWGCPSCYPEADTTAWDAAAFADDLDLRVVAPGVHARDALAQYPYLTRMFTTISPAEMTVDPFFWANPDLPEVDLTSQIATRRSLCNDDSVWTLPDGREVYVASGSAWPGLDGELPYEEEVAQMPAAGAPQTLVDRRAEIATLLAAHNCAHDWPSPADCGHEPPAGSSGSDGGASEQSPEASGCGCRSARNDGWFAMLVLVALRRRVTRRSRAGRAADSRPR